MSLPRFHVRDAAPGARVALPAHTAHHVREVLRLRPGAHVHVFDGHGAEFEAVLDEVSRRTVTLRLGPPVAARPESSLHLVLALSPLKGDRMDLVLQKATELGVTEIRPVVTMRTDAAARPALHGTRSERWDRVVSGAAEQSGRAVVPVVAATATLDALLSVPFPGPRIVLHGAGDHEPLASLSPRPSQALLLVGPAGGFDLSEIDRLRVAGFRPASLGPRVLRAETAAVAAVCIAQVLWGDLGASGEGRPEGGRTTRSPAPR